MKCDYLKPKEYILLIRDRRVKNKVGVPIIIEMQKFEDDMWAMSKDTLWQKIKKAIK